MENKFRSQHGFTLIEAMVAMVLLAIGILSLYTMQVSSITGNSHAGKLTSAATFNAEQVEDIIGVDYDDIEDVAWTDCGAESPYKYYEYKIAVTDDAPTRDLKTVTVTVRDKMSVLDAPVTFTYIKYDLP